MLILAKKCPQSLKKQAVVKKVLTPEPESVEYAPVDEATPLNKERE